MILGLFTELLHAGGVQMAGRQTAAVLTKAARERGLPFAFLSLNDPWGELRIRTGALDFPFRGFHHSKTRFILSALRLAREKPKVIVAAHPHLVPLASAMKELAGGARLVALTHGIEVWKPLSSLRRKALRRADCVLAPSRRTAEALEQFQGLDKARIICLPWGLDPDFLALAQSPETLPLPASFPKGRILLTVGRWAANERYKGVDTLLRAMPSLLENFSDLHLVAVGDGDDRPRLEKLATELGLSGRTRFFAGVTRPELVRCYAQADVFALPSAGEGFGIVFLEAMALGKPVVGGAHGGTPDLIEDGTTGFLVPHGDVNRLIAVLGNLLSSDRLRQQVGQNGRERVRSCYLFQHFESQFLNALRRAAAF